MIMTPGRGQLVTEAVPVAMCLYWVFREGGGGLKNWAQGVNFCLRGGLFTCSVLVEQL